MNNQPPDPSVDIRRFSSLDLALVAFLLLVAGALCAWHWRLTSRSGALAAQVEQLRQASTIVSDRLEDARREKVRFERFVFESRRVEAEREADRWSPALQSIALATGTGIDLRVIRMQKLSEEKPVPVLHLEGSAVGSEPRMVADQFRQRLQRELVSHRQPGAECVFERLEDEPEALPGGASEPKATFQINVQLGSTVVQAAQNLRN